MIAPQDAYETRPKAARFYGWLLASIILTGCQAKPHEQVSFALPASAANIDLPVSSMSIDIAQAPNIARIVVSTLDSQPGIANAAQLVRAQIANIAEQRALLYPQVSAGVASGIVGPGDASPHLQLSASQMIYDFGRTGRGVTREVLRAQKAHLDFLDAVDTELSEMLRVLADYEGQSRQLDLAGERLASMTVLFDLVENRTFEGVATGGSIIEARRKIQAAKTLVTRHELALSNARRSIRAETGATIEASGLNLASLVCGDGPLGTTNGTRAQIAKVNLAIARLDVRNAATARLPTVSLEATANNDLTNLASGQDFGVNLQMNSSIFGGGAARSRLEAASQSEAAAETAVKNELQQAINRYEDAQHSIAIHTVLAPSLQAELNLLFEKRALVREQFLQLGTKTIDDVLDVEDDYHQALVDIEVLQQELIVAQIECLAIKGQLRHVLGVEDTLLYGLALRQ